eukprot:UN21621
MSIFEKKTIQKRTFTHFQTEVFENVIYKKNYSDRMVPNMSQTCLT